VKRDAKGRFVAGHAPLKRSRSIGPALYRDALQADWEEHGAGCIARIRCEQPERYLEIMIGILPRGARRR
jgi:hypothetical protein